MTASRSVTLVPLVRVVSSVAVLAASADGGRPLGD